MTPPREPDRYEEKARDLWHSLRTDAVQAVPALAAALRQAADEALERAAQECERSLGPIEAGRYAIAKRIRALALSPEAPPAKETRNAGLRSGSHADVATADRIDLQGHQSTDGNVVRGLLEEAREVADVLGEGHAADLVARIDVYLATPAPSDDVHPLSLRAEFEKYKKAEKRIAELEAALREVERMTNVGPPPRPGSMTAGSGWYSTLLSVNAYVHGALSRAASPGSPGKEEGR